MYAADSLTYILMTNGIKYKQHFIHILCQSPWSLTQLCWKLTLFQIITQKHKNPFNTMVFQYFPSAFWHFLHLPGLHIARVCSFSVQFYFTTSTFAVFMKKKQRYSSHQMTKIPTYSGPSLKGHSLERTPLQKGHKFLAASTMNVCNIPSHQRTPL